MKRCKNPQCTTGVSDYAPDFCSNHNSENKSTNFLSQFQEAENKKYEDFVQILDLYPMGAPVGKIRAFMEDRDSRLIDKIVEMVNEVISKKEQVHGFQPYHT